MSYWLGPLLGVAMFVAWRAYKRWSVLGMLARRYGAEADEAERALIFETRALRDAYLRGRARIEDADKH